MCDVVQYLPGGFAPPDPPSPSLAGPLCPAPLRRARSLRFASFLCRGASPRRTPRHAHSRAASPRARPFAWARSLRFFAGGLRPPGPPLAVARGAPSPRSAPAGLARFASLAFVLSGTRSGLPDFRARTPDPGSRIPGQYHSSLNGPAEPETRPSTACVG